jgi:hypothetical protein
MPLLERVMIAILAILVVAVLVGLIKFDIRRTTSAHPKGLAALLRRQSAADLSVGWYLSELSAGGPTSLRVV